MKRTYELGFIEHGLKMVREGLRPSKKVEVPLRRKKHKQEHLYIYTYDNATSRGGTIHKFIYKGEYMGSSTSLEKIIKIRNEWMKKKGVK